MGLVLQTNLAQPDETYAFLIAAHEGLSDAESTAFNARLLLILMNHIGDAAVLTEAIRLAKNPSDASRS